MDWQKLTAAVTFGQTLEPDALDAYLVTLSENSPEISEEVRRIIQNARQRDAFMMTAVGDYLPDEKPLYKQGDVIGQWQIDSLLGSGGMGDVYKAGRVDKLYDHTVALKVMRGDDERRKARFDRERQRLATLKHTGIAAIIDGGVSNQGYPYMVMDYVDGQPVFDYVQQKTINDRQILDLFRQVCAAVSHAHNNLILHRDLKSGNILVDSSGHIKLIDFGIATLLEGDQNTEAGPFSLATAAPEQLNGEQVSVQTDIFALGAVLHQLLTGALPIRQPNGSVQVKAENLGRDLEAILDKSLHIEPTRRYETVAALNADIQAYQTSLPVKARNGSRLYRIGKLLKRAPIASALAASFIIALAGGLVVSQHYARAAQTEAERANEELTRAEWALKQAETQNEVAARYADTLQRVFGNEGDVKRMRTILVSHWQEIMDNPDSNGAAKAQISFAMGQHFVSRKDFITALAVLEPWLKDDYGDHTLRRTAKALIAEAYLQTGRRRDAAREVAEVAEMYKGTFEENSPHHVRDLVKAAYYTHDHNIMQNVKTVALETLKTEMTPRARGVIWNQMLQVNLLLGDFDSAYVAAENVVKIGAQTPEYAVTDILTDKSNLCEMVYFIKRRYDEAEQCMKALYSQEYKQLGHNAFGVHIFGIQALAARERKELDKANSLITASLAYDIAPSRNHIAYLAKAEIYGVMINADLRKWDEAQAIIHNAENRGGGHSNQNISLMRAYLHLKKEGPDEAKAYLRDIKFNTRRARNFFRLNYIMDEMTELGLDWDSL